MYKKEMVDLIHLAPQFSIQQQAHQSTLSRRQACS